MQSRGSSHSSLDSASFPSQLTLPQLPAYTSTLPGKRQVSGHPAKLASERLYRNRQGLQARHLASLLRPHDDGYGIEWPGLSLSHAVHGTTALRMQLAHRLAGIPLPGARGLADEEVTMPRLNRLSAFAVIAVMLSIGFGQADAKEPPLILEAMIPLPHVSGRIDHMAFDSTRRRLLVAELGNGSLAAIDLATRQVVHRIAGLDEPQGVGFASGADILIVACGGDGSVRFYRGGDFAPAGTINLGEDADDIRIAPQSEHALVGHGSGALAIIDPQSRTMLGDVKLAAHPEGFELAPDGATVFVNVPNARQIAVVDLAARRQIATWTVPGFAANFPMAIDQHGHWLASVFRRPPRLVLLDTANGSVGARLKTCRDADDVFFDAKRKRIYVSCGAGTIDVFGRRGTTYVHIARIATGVGGRTSLFVPELDRLFVAVPAGLFGKQARILVFRPESP